MLLFWTPVDVFCKYQVQTQTFLGLRTIMTATVVIAIDVLGEALQTGKDLLGERGLRARYNQVGGTFELVVVLDFL